MVGSKLTSKGQTTIPKEIREYLGLHAGDRVIFVREDGKIVLQGLKEALKDLRGRVKARRYPEDFAQVRSHVKRRVGRKVALG